MLQNIPAVGYLFALWGSGDSDIFAAGQDGVMLHYDGLTWEPMGTPATADIRHIHGTGPDDVLAVGDEGMVLHYDGSEWSPVEIGTRNSLDSVTNISGTWFIAGGNGIPTIFRP